MKFSKIYNKIIPHWGTSIILSDVVINKNSYYFPGLSLLHDEIEDIIAHANPWDELMVWTMFQIFHEEAIQCLDKKKTKLLFRGVKKEKIQKKFYENLTSKTSDYQDLVSQYINDVEV